MSAAAGQKSGQFNRNRNFVPKLIGSRFRVQARPGATGCGYEIVFTFSGLGLPSLHLNIPGLGQGFKGYNRWILHTILIKTWNTLHTPLGEAIL
jgi:hypothetical protein